MSAPAHPVGARTSLRQSLLFVLLLTLSAGAIFALRLFERDMLVSARTLILISLAMLSGASCGFILLPGLRRLPVWALGLIFGLGFAPGMAVWNLIYHLLFGQLFGPHIKDDLGSILFACFQNIALFLYSAPPYLLPWPLPLLVLASALLARKIATHPPKR